MEMSVYAEKKEKETVQLQKLAKNFFQLIAKKYDPDTAVEVTPEILTFNFESIESQLKEIDEGILLLTKRRDNLLVLKADMEAIV